MMMPIRRLLILPMPAFHAACRYAAFRRHDILPMLMPRFRAAAAAAMPLRHLPARQPPTFRCRRFYFMILMMP